MRESADSERAIERARDSYREEREGERERASASESERGGREKQSYRYILFPCLSLHVVHLLERYCYLRWWT